MRTRVPRIGLTVVLGLALLTPPAFAQFPRATSRITPLSERERDVHLLSRATYGVRLSDLDEVDRSGRIEWLEAQLHPETIDIVPRDPGQAIYDGFLTRVPHTLAHFKMARAAFSARQLEEVMTDFWFNHFSVYMRKDPAIASAIAHYEEHAIRKHVFGPFEDMLIATARHPAMLVYLDNYLSTIPNPDTLRGSGLNENYARELLELHTLGVDGGYTQRDVVEVARAFTGWGVLATVRTTAALGRRLRVTPDQTDMLFEPERHDQAAKVVMSLELPAGRGIEDGLDVLKILAVHPATANHIATKLVTHFVSDRPPPELVAELTSVFLATGGDLRAVTRTLFSSDLFYEPAHYRSKAKRPFEFIASALRVTGTEVPPWLANVRSQPAPSAQVFFRLLTQMGHAPYMEPAPTGYPSVAEDWMSAQALLQRMTFAADLTSGLEPVLRFDAFEALGLSISSTAALLSQGIDGMPPDALPGIADIAIARLLPGVEAPELRSAIVRDLSQRSDAYPGGLLARAIALTLGSPQFQKY